MTETPPTDVEPVDRLQWSVRRVLGTAPTTGNRVQALRNGDEIFPAMVEAIRSAERCVDFLTFVFGAGEAADEVAAALRDKAAEGLRVRVLLDALGSRKMDGRHFSDLAAAGAEVRLFRPPSWRFWDTAHRTHRKVLICDDRVGMTGGVGVAEEWEGDARDAGEWRDTHFRIEGPAVLDLSAGFLTDWVEDDGVLPDGAITPVAPDDPRGDAAINVVRSRPAESWTDADLTVRALLRAAERTIDICTAYFTPDEALCRLLARRVEDGVRVRMLMPGPHIDKDLVRLASVEECRALVRADVELYRFMPSMLHAKVMVVDDAASMVGSVNLNQRSLAHDHELAAVVYDPELAASLVAHFEEDLDRSEPYPVDEEGVESLATRAAGYALRPIRRWM